LRPHEDHWWKTDEIRQFICEIVQEEIEKAKTIKRVTISAQEAADYLGICYDNLISLAREGKIPHIRVGKQYLFRIPSINAWLDEQERLNSFYQAQIPEERESMFEKRRRAL